MSSDVEQNITGYGVFVINRTHVFVSEKGLGVGDVFD